MRQRERDIILSRSFKSHHADFYIVKFMFSFLPIFDPLYCIIHASAPSAPTWFPFHPLLTSAVSQPQIHVTPQRLLYKLIKV